MPDRMTDARLKQLAEMAELEIRECVREIDRLRAECLGRQADQTTCHDDLRRISHERDGLRSELAEARAVMDRLFREVRGNDDCEDDCIAESCPWMAASDWLGRQSAAQEKEGGDAKRGTGNGTGMSET